ELSTTPSSLRSSWMTSWIGFMVAPRLRPTWPAESAGVTGCREGLFSDRVTSAAKSQTREIKTVSAAVNRCGTQRQKSNAKSLARCCRGVPPLRLRSGQALAQKTRKDGAPTRVIGVDRSILNEELSAADDGGWAL